MRLKIAMAVTRVQALLVGFAKKIEAIGSGLVPHTEMTLQPEVEGQLQLPLSSTQLTERQWQPWVEADEYKARLGLVYSRQMNAVHSSSIQLANKDSKESKIFKYSCDGLLGLGKYFAVFYRCHLYLVNPKTVSAEKYIAMQDTSGAMVLAKASRSHQFIAAVYRQNQDSLYLVDVKATRQCSYHDKNYRAIAEVTVANDGCVALLYQNGNVELLEPDFARKTFNSVGQYATLHAFCCKLLEPCFDGKMWVPIVLQKMIADYWCPETLHNFSLFRSQMPVQAVPRSLPFQEKTPKAKL